MTNPASRFFDSGDHVHNYVSPIPLEFGPVSVILGGTGASIDWSSSSEGTVRAWSEYDISPVDFDNFVQVLAPSQVVVSCTRLSGPRQQNYEIALNQRLVTPPGSWRCDVRWNAAGVSTPGNIFGIPPHFYIEWVCGEVRWTLGGPFVFGAHSPQFTVLVPLGPSRILWVTHANAIEVRSASTPSTLTVDQRVGNASAFLSTISSSVDAWTRVERQDYAAYIEFTSSNDPVINYRWVYN